MLPPLPPSPRDTPALLNSTGVSPRRPAPGSPPRQPVVEAGHGHTQVSGWSRCAQQGLPQSLGFPDHHDILTIPPPHMPREPPSAPGDPKGTPVFLGMCPNPPPALSPGRPALPWPPQQSLAGDPRRMLGPSGVSVPGQECPSGGPGLAGGRGEEGGETVLPGQPSRLPHRDPRNRRGEGAWCPGPEAQPWLGALRPTVCGSLTPQSPSQCLAGGARGRPGGAQLPSAWAVRPAASLAPTALQAILADTSG